ncbi:MAG TPA: hypothetical protein VNT32_02505 [Thermoleophilaceae bacterium]|nr:hypothetical protein [Thermoleophilaceae bacterium]
MSLRSVLDGLDPLLASHAVADPGEGRFAGFGDEARGFVLEAVHEGYLLHYGQPRALRGMDDDLRLLAGDALYALGLARISEAGDLEAVAELADLISLSAQARAEQREDLADEAWEASAAMLEGRSGSGARAAVGDRLAFGR